VEVVSGKDILRSSNSDFPWTIFSPDGRILAGAHQTETILAPGTGLMRVERPAIRVVDVITRKPVGELPAHPTTTNAWAISPGGGLFASANPNHTILVWDLTWQGLKPLPREKKATRDELEKLWADLLREDARAALRSASELVAASVQSVPFLCERLKPVPEPSAQAIVNHIKLLDSARANARQQARLALEQLEELAEPALRQVLETKPSLEVRRQVEAILEKLDRTPYSPERVRAARALAVLEQAASEEARKHLQLLAGGAPAAWLTQEARSAAERLAKRGAGRER